MRYVKTKQFDKMYAKAPEQIQRAFDKQLTMLLKDSHHPSLDAKKYGDTNQARVTRGSWRFLLQYRRRPVHHPLDNKTSKMKIDRQTWSTAVAEARQGRGEDRIATAVLPDRIITLVADGAGGVSGGAEAAETLRTELYMYVEGTRWDDWLVAIDRRMSVAPRCGLAAAVVVEIRNDGSVVGASVGDCEAWIFGEGEPRSLIDHQHRKPFLGSGEAVPVPFAAHISGGTLVVGSDGLWKYASGSRIREAAAIRPLEVATAKLVDAVRLKSGGLQDDAAIFIYATEEK